MARLDGTGPRGEGPMTGRAMGYCREDLDGETDRPLYREGLGRRIRRRPNAGRGLGRGRNSGRRR